MTASEPAQQERASVALERFRAAVPRADGTEIASGHDPLADAPETTLATVCAWLADLTPGPPASAPR